MNRGIQQRPSLPNSPHSANNKYNLLEIFIFIVFRPIPGRNKPPNNNNLSQSTNLIKNKKLKINELEKQIEDLNAKKIEAVSQENYTLAAEYKKKIEILDEQKKNLLEEINLEEEQKKNEEKKKRKIELEKEIERLTQLKKDAVENEEYQIANDYKLQISKLKAELEELPQ